jgi:3',5'-cyclic-AMP phosphodiesterase
MLRRNVATRRLIIQISDMHLVQGGELRAGVDPRANLEKVLGALKLLRRPPDVLLFTGDLTDTGNEVAYRQLRELVEPVGTGLGADVIYLPGNHDSRAAMREHLLGEAPSTEPMDGVWWREGLRIITLDSTVPGVDQGELADRQLEWLAELLTERAPEGTLLALHHPPIVSPIEQMAAIALQKPERLGAVIAGSDIALVVCGHYHHASSGVLGGIAVSVASSSAYRAEALVEERFVGLVGSSFSRIDIENGNAVVSYLPV